MQFLKQRQALAPLEIGQVAVYIINLYLSIYVMHRPCANHGCFFLLGTSGAFISKLECAFYTTGICFICICLEVVNFSVLNFPLMNSGRGLMYIKSNTSDPKSEPEVLQPGNSK